MDELIAAPSTVSDNARRQLDAIKGRKSRETAYWHACMGILAALPERANAGIFLLIMSGRCEEAFNYLSKPDSNETA